MDNTLEARYPLGSAAIGSSNLVEHTSDRAGDSALVLSGLKWFCVRSQPKHEHVAAANLRRHLQLEVVNPRIRFKRPTSRGPIWVTESLFPNYLFAHFDWKTTLETVRYIGGVSGVVHFGVHWPTIPDEIILGLRQLIGEEEVRTIEQTLQVGDEVEVAGGAFGGFQAIISRVIPARQRVAVLLDFLGRQTVVELKMDELIINGLRYGSRQILARALA